MPLSAQQQAFVDFLANGKGSVVLEAVAGSGKTSSLMQGVKVLDGQTALVAFNKAIATELKNRLEKMGIGFRQAQAGTAHSFGFSAVRKAYGSVKVADNKTAVIIDRMINGNDLDPLNTVKTAVITMVGLAKQRAIGVATDIDDYSEWAQMMNHFNVDVGDDPDAMRYAIEQAQAVLTKSNRMTDVIDFNDMVYLPLIHNLRMWQFDNLMVDEAQDTNAARRMLYRKMLKYSGRMIAVGDPCQPKGTKVLLRGNSNRWNTTPPIEMPIENLKVGDEVVSYRVSDSAFLPNGRRVSGISVKKFRGDLVRVIAAGRSSDYTPHHFCMASFKPLEGQYAVYLMLRGRQFRVGYCRMGYDSSSGLSSRARAEMVDGAWILKCVQTKREARRLEQVIIGKYGISGLQFANKICSKFSQSDFDLIWSDIGSNFHRGKQALEDFGRDMRYPFWEAGNEYFTVKRVMRVRACNLLDGCLVKPYSYESGNCHSKLSDMASALVTRTPYNGEVYSLSVDDTNIYVADGIVTYNCQAIYGFTGADANSLDLIRKQYKARTLPLSVTFRCSKAVVQFANQWVSHIEACEDAQEGAVRQANLSQLFQPGYLLPTDAILCRNTAPLVKTAFTLIRNKIACRVEGRDIGMGLVKLAQRWKSNSISELRNNLDKYEEREVKKAREKEKESQAQSVMDTVNTLRVVMDEATLAGEKSISDVVARIKAIFETDVKDVVTLSTIHKSKGREWPRVFWLIREQTCPSPWAKKRWEREQEDNLCYVAATRAEDVLVDVVDDTREEG